MNGDLNGDHKARLAVLELRIQRRLVEEEAHNVMAEEEREIPYLRLLRVLYEAFRDVDGCHASAAFDKQPRVVPFSAPDVQAREPIHLRQHVEERRRVEIVPVDVVPRPREPGPRVGISVPAPADLPVIHSLIPFLFALALSGKGCCFAAARPA